METVTQYSHRAKNKTLGTNNSNKPEVRCTVVALVHGVELMYLMSQVAGVPVIAIAMENKT